MHPAHWEPIWKAVMENLESKWKWRKALGVILQRVKDLKHETQPDATKKLLSISSALCYTYWWKIKTNSFCQQFYL